MGEVRDVLVKRKVICRNFDSIKPLLEQLDEITMSSEEAIRDFVGKLLNILGKIMNELREEKKEKADEKSCQILLDAFDSLYSHVGGILHR